jgi:hypothetical protein
MGNSALQQGCKFKATAAWCLYTERIAEGTKSELIRLNSELRFDSNFVTVSGPFLRVKRLDAVLRCSPTAWPRFLNA